jgi:hypothetical protein
MARGWESKEVEAQIESFEIRRAPAQKFISPEESERNRQRDSLQLSRTRVMNDLETANNPRYKSTLTAALKHLDEKLSQLG